MNTISLTYVVCMYTVHFILVYVYQHDICTFVQWRLFFVPYAIDL